MFLGVDGGGTKTAFCLLTAAGDVVGSATGPTSYHYSEGLDRVTDVLRAGVSAVCEQASVSPAEVGYGFFGLPGYGEASALVPVLDAIGEAVLGHRRYGCDNDAVCAWAGSLGLVDGVNVISGTGSLAYGERGARRARAGGWGEVFGDEGSAYWIAIRGLGAFSQMSDGRAPRGPLYELMRDRLEVSSDLDVVDVVLNAWHGSRMQLAGLSPMISSAAAHGDRCAAEILTEAAAQLAGVARAVRDRLEWSASDVVPISYSGGVFAAGVLTEQFTSQLRASGQRWNVQAPRYPAAVGGALYAARLAGTPLSGSAMNRLAVAADAAPS